MLTIRGSLQMKALKQTESERKRYSMQVRTKRKQGWLYYYQAKHTLSQKLLKEINENIIQWQNRQFIKKIQQEDMHT